MRKTNFLGELKRKQIKGSMVVELILIVVVLIALVALFKSELTDLVGDIFDKITRQGSRI